MVKYVSGRLDASFSALSDVTRRGVLEQLGRADASITELAGKFHMTLTGMKKHVGVLEQAGLVTTKKIGRVRTCQLGPRRLEEETDRKSTRLNSSHLVISYAVFCLKKKKTTHDRE